METEDRIRRFDDVFRTLLIVGTILFSFSITFQKEMGAIAFTTYVIAFGTTIICWCFGKLCSGLETTLKIIAWFFLGVLTLTGYIRMVFFFNVLPVEWSIVIVTIAYCLSNWLFLYLPHDQYSGFAMWTLTGAWLTILYYPSVQSLVLISMPSLPRNWVILTSFLSSMLSSYGALIVVSIVLRKLKRQIFK